MSTGSHPLSLTWDPDRTYVKELEKIGGRMFKTHLGYRVIIPDNAWEEYRDNPFSMDPEKLYNFQQLAWSYVNQFNNQTFKSTLDNISFFSDLKGDIHRYGKLARGTAAQYIQLITVIGTYKIIANWVEQDLWYDPLRVVLTSEGKVEDIDRPTVISDNESPPSLMDISSSDDFDSMEVDSPPRRSLRSHNTQSDSNLRGHIKSALSTRIIPLPSRFPSRKNRKH